MPENDLNPSKDMRIPMRRVEKLPVIGEKQPEIGGRKCGSSEEQTQAKERLTSNNQNFGAGSNQLQSYAYTHTHTQNNTTHRPLNVYFPSSLEERILCAYPAQRLKVQQGEKPQFGKILVELAEQRLAQIERPQVDPAALRADTEARQAALAADFAKLEQLEAEQLAAGIRSATLQQQLVAEQSSNAARMEQNKMLRDAYLLHNEQLYDKALRQAARDTIAKHGEGACTLRRKELRAREMELLHELMPSVAGIVQEMEVAKA